MAGTTIDNVSDVIYTVLVVSSVRDNVEKLSGLTQECPSQIK
jgi:hypothetical protein